MMRGLESGQACSYTCGGVFFWANHLWTPTPGVKVSRRSIDDVIEHHYKCDLPGKLPQPMVIGIIEDKCPVMEMKGALRMVSPCEFAHAALKACYQDIKSGKDDSTIRTWRRLFLSVEMTFVRCDEKQLSTRSFQLREDAIAEASQVGWTAIQRVQMIVREKHLLESRGGRCTAAKLAAHFSSKVKLARSSEPITSSFVDTSLTIESRVLCLDMARTALEHLDDSCGVSSPLNSVYKLQVVVDRAKTPKGIEWVFVAMVDSLGMGWVDASEFTVAKMKQETVDVYLLKSGFHAFLLVDFLDRHPFDNAAKATIRGVLADHTNVRKRICNYPEMPPADLSWQSSEKPSTVKYIELVEATGPLFARCVVCMASLQPHPPHITALTRTYIRKRRLEGHCLRRPVRQHLARGRAQQQGSSRGGRVRADQGGPRWGPGLALQGTASSSPHN